MQNIVEYKTFSDIAKLVFYKNLCWFKHSKRLDVVFAVYLNYSGKHQKMETWWKGSILNFIAAYKWNSIKISSRIRILSNQLVYIINATRAYEGHACKFSEKWLKKCKIFENFYKNVQNLKMFLKISCDYCLK